MKRKVTTTVPGQGLGGREPVSEEKKEDVVAVKFLTAEEIRKAQDVEVRVVNIPEWGGVRIEDLTLIDKNGVELQSRASKEPLVL